MHAGASLRQHQRGRRPFDHVHRPAKTDGNFTFANIAVRHGYVGRYPDGSFRGGEAVTDAAALAGLVQGLGLSEQAKDAAGLWPGKPAYTARPSWRTTCT